MIDTPVSTWLGVAAYLAVLLLIGVVASRRMRDSRDYFAAGKSLGFWSVAFSARATGESGWLLLGLTGMGAVVGAQAFWVVLGEALGVAVAWLVMARRFKRLTDRYDAITIPDYLEARFRDGAGHRLRLVSAVAILCFVLVYVSAQIDATGSAFESFLQVDYHVGALIGFAVVLVYITAGGFLAVVWSDVFQGALMFFGLVVLPAVGLASIGGFGALHDGLVAIDPGLVHPAGSGGWTGMSVLAVAGFLMIGLGFLGSPQIFVRFLALRDEREIHRGAAVAITWTLLAEVGAVLIGMIGRVIFEADGLPEAAAVAGQAAADLGNNGQGVLPYLVNALMPPLLVGLYIAIVLSAIMSTVDSLLVLAASAAVRDYWQQVRHPELRDDQLMRGSRAVTIALAVLALGVAMIVSVTVPTRNVFWFVLVGFYGLAATFCPTIILSLFWRGMTARGALWAMTSGFFAMLLFQFAVPRVGGDVGAAFEALTPLPPAFLISMLAAWWGSKDARGRAAVADVGAELDAAAASTPPSEPGPA